MLSRLSNAAVVTGDFNNPQFYGSPDRPVRVGDLVIAHDDDPTVDDYWARVVSVRPPETLYGPNAADRHPYGLATLKVSGDVV